MKEKPSIYIVLFIIVEACGLVLYGLHQDRWGLLILSGVATLLLGLHYFMYKKESISEARLKEVDRQLSDMDDRLRKLSNSRF